MELAGFTFGYSRYFSRVPEFSEKEKKERKRERERREKEREGRQGRREREKISVTTCDNCTSSLLTFRVLYRELDMIYEL